MFKIQEKRGKRWVDVRGQMFSTQEQAEAAIALFDPDGIVHPWFRVVKA